MKILYKIFISFFLISCNSKEQSNKEINIVKTNSSGADIESIDDIKENKFIDFPIPELDSIFPYFETSGSIENSPSERFYNPSDSGIFVFYTLFDKNKMKNAKHLFDEVNIGTLITHTYRKPKYGWSATDKDQTFIQIHLDGKLIKIGKSIEIGISFNELINELGKPIYQVDSTYTFLGKNKVVGQFTFKNGKLETLIYGRFNLSDKIFDIDSISRKEIIEGKIE